MSSITLVRHGQAAYMSEDYERLSPLGEEQARKLGEFWARHQITYHQVFCGPAKRHRRTMEIASEPVIAAGLPWPEAPTVLPEFDEFDAFEIFKRMLPILSEHDPEVRRLHEDFRANQHSPEAGRLLQKTFEAVSRHWCTGEFTLPEVESWAQFRERIRTGWQHIRAATPKSTQSVVFTSGGPTAASLAEALELTPQKAIEFVWLTRNGSWSEFLISGDRFSLGAYNATPHLDERRLITYR